MNTKNHEFEWPEQKEKQVVANIRIDDTPWIISIIAHANITIQRDGTLGASPVVTTGLFYEGGSKNSAVSWTLTSGWNFESIVNNVHRHLTKREIPVPDGVDDSLRTALNQAKKNAFLAMVSGQAHTLINEISYEEAMSAWGLAEIASILNE